MYKKYCEKLNKLEEISCKRFVQNIKKQGKYIIKDEKRLLNLSSNDYLGISENFDIINDFLKTSNFSFGSASSRLLTGTSPVYKELEETLCNIFNKESALIFNSGYHANVGIISSLADSKDVIFSDKLNHASMVDGMQLSGSTFHRFKHLDYDHLEFLLEKYRDKYENAIITSESVFSMDGDIADLKRLVELKKKHKAILIIDEAHAFGIFGEKALGLAEKENLLDEIDLIVATFGKSIGSIGAFTVGNKILIEYLTNKARSFIFSTALPEINIAYSKYIIEKILPQTKESRIKLLETAANLRENIVLQGLKTLGNSHIIPIIIGQNSDTVEKCNILQNNGFFVLPIRHPTVPEGTARIRLSLRTDIKYKEIERIPSFIK